MLKIWSLYFKATLICLVCLLSSSAAVAQALVYGIQTRTDSPMSQPRWQLFLCINDDSSIANPLSALFNDGSGVFGAAFKDGIFYHVEWESGTSNYYLATTAHEGNANSSRVSGTPIGFVEMNALANVEGQLMAISLDTPNHVSLLISIDDSNGTGTLIGQGSFNVILRGLAYDPLNKVLYGAGIPWGGGATAVNENNLYTVDTATGATTLVGDMGTRLESLTWTPSRGLVGAFDRLYQVDTNTGTATPIGETDLTDGQGVGPEIDNGVWALAAQANLDDIELTPFSVTSMDINGEGQLQISWDSLTARTFWVECNSTLDGETWNKVSPDLPGEPVSMSYTIADPISLDPRFYRVVKSLP